MSLLREFSEQAVLESIFRLGPITRPEIAAATSLSKPTVSAVVRQLEQAGLVSDRGRRSGQRGRSPVAYVVNPHTGFVVGVDVGGVNVHVATADLFGETISHRRESTSRAGGRAVAQQLADLVTAAIEEASPGHGPALALSVASPGIIDARGGRLIVGAHNVAPDGAFDPLEALRERFDMPVLVDNNMNLSAIGEKSFGLGRGVSNMVFVGVGAGVGLGIIVGDELVHGAHGAAGEIAYLPLGDDPFHPRHRLRGGLEDEVGAAGIMAAYEARRTAVDPEIASAHDLFDLAATGNATARAVVDRVASLLGAAIGAVCAILDPELVILGGGIGANPLLLSPVRGSAASLVPITARVVASSLGERAAVQGALAVALSEARATLFPGGLAPPRR